MHVSVQSKGIKVQVQNWFQGDWSVFFHRKTFVWLIVLEIQHANKHPEGILPT